MVEPLMSTLKINQNAPSFSLTDLNFTQVHLKELIGKKKIVLAFFPGAFTSTCTTELCTLRDNLTKINSLDATVIGISVNDPFTNKAFAAANRLNFPILSDYTREVIRRYGVVHEDFAGLIGYTAAKRSVFIINTEGVIKYRWITEDPSKEPPYEKIQVALAEIQ